MITRAAHLGRHHACPTAPGAAVVEGASRAGHGYRVVRYAIDGAQLTDDWRYGQDRWRFDLVRSNPEAVRLYRLPARQHLARPGRAASR